MSGEDVEGGKPYNAARYVKRAPPFRLHFLAISFILYVERDTGDAKE